LVSYNDCNKNPNLLADPFFQITITLKLVDASNGNSPIKHATVRIGVDGETSTIEVTTNEAGKATFDVSTKVRRLTLQLIDAPEDVKEPIFELHDEAPNFLKDADVDITVLERMVRDQMTLDVI
jgi:hypothetical protein